MSHSSRPAPRFSSATLRLVDAHRQLVAAEHTAYDAARALQCTDPADIPAAFRVAAVARDYATDCRARYEQLRGMAL